MQIKSLDSEQERAESSLVGNLGVENFHSVQVLIFSLVTSLEELSKTLEFSWSRPDVKHRKEVIKAIFCTLHEI